MHFKYTDRYPTKKDMQQYSFIKLGLNEIYVWFLLHANKI